MERNKQFGQMATKTLAFCALLTAISVVLARLLSFAPVPEVRISLDKFPIFLAGMLFGPVAGAMVGFAADFIGCLLSPYGFNPIFTLPAILYGLFGGLYRPMLSKRLSVPRLALAYLQPVLLGSWLYQSAALAFVYSGTTFLPAFTAHLASRGVQFGVTLVLEVMILSLLMQSRIFTRLGVWPPIKFKRGSENDDC